MVREHERAGARAAFAAVDVAEVDAAQAGRHQRGEVAEQPELPDRRLDTDRQPALRREELHEVEEAIASWNAE